MSATTDRLRAEAIVQVGFTVEPVSAWIVHCEVDGCTEEAILTARPGITRARAARQGADWMVKHRLECPGGPEKRSDRK